jgi:hypothetical protein
MKQKYVCTLCMGVCEIRVCIVFVDEDPWTLKGALSLASNYWDQSRVSKLCFCGVVFDTR